ncbi:hypothetical protein PICMEDRAFT_72619 [Pichia membranifaciens NRRL Y-2026]|uniref:Uncharacterized protein n=1 Tax=Pichia membranifaciens NRRL Y-2026 TaxID=763406 RepID=A0A1E3NMF4_9ASCO|nr:hypothetical protein PICMEDRAFT_72619 [Pichia membranifaciens NRRL Y-2026]ODQ46563.1 hypothetical protein PICMEDRAFT_72619 [Pichia membranifaciens NRRL Y-2026]
MRSLPQPRYSRTRTIQRIFRSIINLFSTGYVSDSSAFAHHTVLDKSSRKTRIRTSRVTGKPTPRNTMVNKLGTKLVSELIEDEGLISKVVQNEIGGLAEGVGGASIVNDINHRSKKSIFSFWKSGEKPDLSL